jgi:hypothetical protein
VLGPFCPYWAVLRMFFVSVRRIFDYDVLHGSRYFERKKFWDILWEMIDLVAESLGPALYHADGVATSLRLMRSTRMIRRECCRIEKRVIVESGEVQRNGD